MTVYSQMTLLKGLAASLSSSLFIVLAVLVTAIHVFFRKRQDVDARDKPAHDDFVCRTE
jgi:hypothetical protein